MFSWIPRCAAGPVKAADCPRRMDRDVTPGACARADAASDIATAPNRVRVTRASSERCGADYCGRPTEPNASRLPSGTEVSRVTLEALAFATPFGGTANTTITGLLVVSAEKAD